MVYWGRLLSQGVRCSSSEGPHSGNPACDPLDIAPSRLCSLSGPLALLAASEPLFPLRLPPCTSLPVAEVWLSPVSPGTASLEL